MVLHEHGDAVVCVGQASHAWMSGQLARAWGNGAFAAPDPFEEVCLGAEQHDVGMAEWDLRPRLDASTGRPTSFMDMPVDVHLELWGAAPHRLVTQSPYAALLVSMHGHALYARRGALDSNPQDAGAIGRYLAEQEAFQERVIAALGEDPERARRNQRLIWALDFLSLALLLGWTRQRVVAPTRPGAPNAELLVESSGRRRLTVSPWPFATDTIALRCQGRRLEGHYEDEPSLHAAFERAPWVSVRCELTRWRPGQRVRPTAGAA